MLSPVFAPPYVPGLSSGTAEWALRLVSVQIPPPLLFQAAVAVEVTSIAKVEWFFPMGIPLVARIFT